MRPISDKPIPSDELIEREVLGMMMALEDNEHLSQILTKISVDDFLNRNHKLIYKSISEIAESNEIPDMIQVIAKTPNLEELVIAIYADIVTTAMIDQRVHILREVTAKRKTYLSALEYANTFYESSDISTDIINLASLLTAIASTLSDESISRDIEYISTLSPQDGASTGFITHDRNDGGLKEGCITLVSGIRGHGKTTWIRQILVAVARQRIRSSYFIGESSMQEEKRAMVQLTCQPHQIFARENLGGRVIYEPTQEAVEQFNKHFEGYISMCDTSSFRNKPIFKSLLDDMVLRAKGGTKIFVLDSLMVLCSKNGNEVFTEQKYIMQMLSRFVKRFKAHVILVAHPNKGGVEISGATEIQNLADTIVRYARVNPSEIENSIGLPDYAFNDVTAVIFNEKVRNNGTRDPIFLKWDVKRGAVIEMTMNRKAKEDLFYWSDCYSRMSDEDVPDYDKQYK